MNHKEKLLKKILEKEAYLAVVGLGYVGLPLAVEMAKKGYRVLGIDIDESKVSRLLQGESYVIDVKSEDVQDMVAAERLTVSTDFAGISQADTVSICVPTPLRKTKDPDISYINASVSEIKKFLHPGMLIVLESTTYPGTTDELVKNELELLGYKAGEDLFVAFSPERVDPGNQIYQTHNTPKVMGGVTPACTELAVAVYGNVVSNIVPVSSTRSAEMVKLLENTFRSVNIALVNEMALLCDRMKIDIWEVIDAAATKPFGFMPFYPGPGIGGHCIPLDPMYLSWKAKTFDFYNRFIELASDINGNMPRFVVSKISEVLNTRKKCLNGAKILLLGMSYKKDIDDLRESPALELFYLLEETGAVIDYCDELAPSFEHERRHGEIVKALDLDADMLKSYDLVVLTTDHSYFDYTMIAANAGLILDCRNGFKKIKAEHIYKL